MNSFIIRVIAKKYVYYGFYDTASVADNAKHTLRNRGDSEGTKYSFDELEVLEVRKTNDASGYEVI